MHGRKEARLNKISKRQGDLLTLPLRLSQQETAVRKKCLPDTGFLYHVEIGVPVCPGLHAFVLCKKSRVHNSPKVEF